MDRPPARSCRRHVDVQSFMESLSGDMLEGMPAETEELLPVGSRATVDGLQSRFDLNGREAEIQSWLPQKGRCVLSPWAASRARGFRSGHARG